MDCCDTFTGECNQGHNCPVRALHAANHDVFPLRTGEGLKCPPRQSIRAQTATDFVAFETANSDGSSQHSTEVWELTPLGWAVLAALIAGLVFAAYYFFLKP